jgi:Zn-dependent protease
MDKGALAGALIDFLAFIAFVALHEFAHARMAVWLGDDTPRLQGRLTLDPIAHIDLVGTIILPLIMIFSTLSTGHPYFVGWGKPVMVNLNNLRVRRRDDMLVSFAGPFMNLLIAIVMLGLMRVGVLAGFSVFEDKTLFHLVQFTVLLFFFNLLPVPPLDGGHIMRNFLNISDEAYAQISQYSFILFVILLNSSVISGAINSLSLHTTILLGKIFGWHLGVY